MWVVKVYLDTSHPICGDGIEADIEDDIEDDIEGILILHSKCNVHLVECIGACTFFFAFIDVLEACLKGNYETDGIGEAGLLIDFCLTWNLCEVEMVS